MPIDPNIALSVRPIEIPSPIQTIGSLMQMRGAMAQLAHNQALAEQERQNTLRLQAETALKNRELADQNTVQELSKDPANAKAFGAGDFTSLNGKVQPGTLNKLTEAHATLRDKLATTHQHELDNMGKEHGIIEKAINGLKSLGDDAAIATEAPQVFARLQAQGVIPPNTPMPQVTGAKDLDRYAAQNAWLQGAIDAALKTKKEQQGIEVQAAQEGRAEDKEVRDVASAPAALRKLEADATVAEFKAAHPEETERDNRTADIKEYEYAKDQGFKGTFPEWQTAQANRRAPSAATSASGDDVSETARAIIEGKAVPVLSNYSFRDRTKLAAALHRAGYDQATAERDWKAIQRHLSTLNGAQQERLRQAITFTSDSLDNIENLYGEWQKSAPTSGFKILNKATLAAAKQTPGRMGSLATNLEAQINDLTSELGTVYKGGNASTDESLRLAAGNLKAEWNEQTFKDAIKQIRKNLGIRKNSIETSAAAGVSPDSPYSPADERPQASAYKEGQTATNPKTGEKLIFKGGKWVPR